MKKLFYFASIAALAFSSCTKDSTDVVAPATPVGKAAFTATMSIGEGETRHGLGTNAEGKRVYVWDKGDMVSVNSDLQPAKNLPFITVDGGTEAAFTAVADDLNYLGREGVNYYMTYPWCDKSYVEPWIDEKTGELYANIYGLQVPAEQRYRENSFATMTAPAFMVTPAEDVNDGDKLEFKSAASYFRVPVKGVGKLQQLSLYIDGQTIAGDIGVYVTSDEEEAEDLDMEKLGDNYYEIYDASEYAVTNTADGMQGSTSVIVVDFGATPLKLDPTTAKDIFFVIKSGIYLEGAQIGHTAWLEDAEEPQEVYYNYPTWGSSVDEQYGDVENQWENIQPNMVFHGKPIVLGVEGYAVNNEVDFITWAYVNWMMNYPKDTTNPFGDNYTSSDAITEINLAKLYENILLSGIVKERGGFQPAILLSDLDFANVDENDAATELQKLAMAWFKNNIAKNGAMIPTLMGAEIIGNDFEMANLEVGGAAFMANAESVTRAAAEAAATINSKISNVTLKNFSIEAAEDASRVNMFEKNHASGTIIKEVIIDGGSLNGGKADAKTGVTHYTYASTFEQLVMESYPTVGENDANYAQVFIVNDDADLSKIYNDNANAIVTLRSASNAANAGGVIAVNEVENIVETVMESVSIEAPANWFSVVIDEVSYWTGVEAPSTRKAVDEEDIYGAMLTAEEFARLRKFDGEYTITLTNDIDLLNIALPAVATNTSKVVNGGEKTIYNVNITNGAPVTSEDEEGNEVTETVYTATVDGYYSLFGANADIADLTVDGLNIDVKMLSKTKDTYVSGLAYKGSADNVKVVGAELKLQAQYPDFGYKPVGIVIGNTDAAKVVNVYVEGTLSATNVPAFKMTPIGMIVGQLSVGDHATIAAAYKNGISGANSITMWKNTATGYDATKLYNVAKDGTISAAANVYSGKMFGTVNVSGINYATTAKHTRDFNVVAPENAPAGWVDPITSKSKAYAQHIAGGFNFDNLNESFHLLINFYDGAYEQDLAYVEPVAEEE